MITRRFFTQAGVLALGAGTAWLAHKHLFWPAPTLEAEGGAISSGWLPFAAPSQPIVTIKVAVNGRTAIALVDSGAQNSVIDREFAGALGVDPAIAPPSLVFGAGGNGQVAQVGKVELAMGDLGLSGVRVATLDLGPIARAEGLGAPVIIGQDILGVLVADIDFPGRRIRFLRPGAVPLPPGAIAAPARPKGSAVAVRVTVEGKPVEVVVDTGASGVLSLSSNVAEQLGLLDGRRLRFGSSIVLGGVATGRVLKARTVEIAGHVRRDVDVYIFDAQRIPGFPAGLLGFGALRRHRVILDCGQGTLHLVDPGLRAR